MELSRRDFLKASGAGLGGILALGAFSNNAVLARPFKSLPLKKKIGEKTTICPYCGCGCGFVVAADNGKVVNVEGDPDHPVNQGGACAKGAALRQIGAENPRRLSKVLYRAPGASDWEEKSWDWTLNEITRRIKNTRDANFTEKDSKGNLVNRTDAIAHLGGAALDNEECYVLSKLNRAMGVAYLEHHARV